MSHANGWCRQCNNSLCWAGTYSLGCAETSHKLEGNVGRERAAWLETFQWRAGGWSATPGNCDGKIIRVLSTGRSCSDLHSADEKMSIEGDVKGEKPQRAQLPNLDRTLSFESEVAPAPQADFLCRLCWSSQSRLGKGTLTFCGPCQQFQEHWTGSGQVTATNLKT